MTQCRDKILYFKAQAKLTIWLELERHVMHWQYFKTKSENGALAPKENQIIYFYFSTYSQKNQLEDVSIGTHIYPVRILVFPAK